MSTSSGPARLSVLIPARNEERALPGCLAAIQAAAQRVPAPVELIVAANRCTDGTEEIARANGARVVHDDSRSLSAIRNTAARAATGDVLVTIDADSRMSVGMLASVDHKLRSGRYVGGGTVLPDRWSAGIVLTGVALGMVLACHRVSSSASLYSLWAFSR